MVDGRNTIMVEPTTYYLLPTTYYLLPTKFEKAYFWQTLAFIVKLCLNDGCSEAHAYKGKGERLPL